jgi:hypothetical protein
MIIWHATIDAPRTPRRVSPGQGIDVIVGSWPIGPGQSVWVTWQRVGANGDATEGNAVAEWQRNSDVNSYCSGPRALDSRGRTSGAHRGQHDASRRAA